MCYNRKNYQSKDYVRITYIPIFDTPAVAFF